MPFQSEAHRAKFKELVKEGKITQKEYDKWEKETGNRKLPERKTLLRKNTTGKK